MIRPAMLLLPYEEWKQLIEKFFESLSCEQKEWIHEWNKLDLHLSPMDDIKRKFMRFGHYYGWFAKVNYNDFV